MKLYVEECVGTDGAYRYRARWGLSSQRIYTLVFNQGSMRLQGEREGGQGACPYLEVLLSWTIGVVT